MRALGISKVNRDDFVFGGILIGVQVQLGPVICDATEEPLAIVGNNESLLTLHIQLQIRLLASPT